MVQCLKFERGTWVIMPGGIRYYLLRRTTLPTRAHVCTCSYVVCVAMCVCGVNISLPLPPSTFLSRSLSLALSLSRPLSLSLSLFLPPTLPPSTQELWHLCTCMIPGTMSATGIVISLIFLFDMQYRCVHMAAHGAHNYAIIVHCGVGCRNYN